MHGTALGERKGINAPGVALPSAGLTPKDADDLRFGLALGVDMVALSFVQTAADLQAARAVMDSSGRVGVPLIAKIERPQPLAHMDEVLDACDGVMVARGDLGLELPLERVPRVQKEITVRARARGLPVILATQVLESMRTEPRPTRAEVSDAANAVDDGVDAIMLAGETASGAYPARSVQTLDAIINDAEAVAPLAVEVTGASPMHAGHGRAICEAAVTLATRGAVQAIVAITRQGNTARVLSSLQADGADHRRHRLCRSGTPVGALPRRAALRRRDGRRCRPDRTACGRRAHRAPHGCAGLHGGAGQHHQRPVTAIRQLSEAASSRLGH